MGWEVSTWTYTFLLPWFCIVVGGLFLRQWLCGAKCKSKAKLHGKTVIITGGNTGIGMETAKDLVRRGARVIIACRDTVKGENAASEIRRATLGIESAGTVAVRPLNLSSLKSVREFAKNFLETEPSLHILINNAGIAACPKGAKTEEGFDMQFGVNHLGHFLLTSLLLERLKQCAPARIVNVASIAHMGGKIHFDDINMEKKYDPIMAYCQSKLANILFTRELARRLEGTGITVYSLHPGAVQTGLFRYMDSSYNNFVGACFRFFGGMFFKTPEQGAQTTIYCAVAEEVEKESGLYYSDCRKKEPARHAKNDKVAKQLWELSEEMIEQKFGI